MYLCILRTVFSGEKIIIFPFQKDICKILFTLYGHREESWFSKQITSISHIPNINLFSTGQRSFQQNGFTCKYLKKQKYWQLHMYLLIDQPPD